MKACVREREWRDREVYSGGLGDDWFCLAVDQVCDTVGPLYMCALNMKCSTYVE